jgi:CelD/BcsL family acetyltransferase involved in cellulose biosynthesis
LKVETYTEQSVFETFRAEWNQLLDQTAVNRIFLTWEWQSNWWAAYQPGQLWILAVRHDDGQLVGLAPWFIEEREKTGRTVRSIGCVDVTDYLTVMAHQDYEQAVFEALAEYVTENQSHYDTIDLCNIPENTSILKYLPALLEERGFEVEVKLQDVCPVIDLPDDWADYMDLLDKKQRHELRRKMRRAQSANMDWYTVDDEAGVDAELDVFLELMAAASPEKAEFLQDEKNVRFFKLVIPEMHRAGWLQLAFLKIDEAYAAAYLNFIYQNDVLVYNSGLNLEVGAALSPGIILLANLIREAIEQGRSRFDFLRGDEKYKYQMGGQDTQVFMMTVVHDKVKVPA